ncbi:AprI/Inh family metalloprotease inhibitor [Bauldia sp.]|uniref:AprI/Inh family metalloprotease inhibitor n=1 Tax=Bauldia sp. TaxID=2575872 RepID=UPI003BAC928F
MPVNRFVPIALAVTLCGCGSIGAIGVSPGNRNPPPGQVAGGLPPPGGVAGPPGGAVIAEPLPPATAPGATTVAANAPPAGAAAPAAPAPAPSASLGRTDLLGGWTIASSGESCQLFMTLTSWTGGYRASTRGCSSETLKSISAWNLQGQQVVLAGQGGTPVARLQSSGGSRFDGATEGGGPVSFYR